MDLLTQSIGSPCYLIWTVPVRIIYSGCPNKREGTEVLKRSVSEKIITHLREVKIRKIFEDAFFNLFFITIPPTSFWVITHPQEVKIRCNFEDALRKLFSRSENWVKFWGCIMKIILRKWKSGAILSMIFLVSSKILFCEYDFYASQKNAPG